MCRPPSRALRLAPLVLAAAAGMAQAQSALAPVTVEGNYAHPLGATDSASEGVVTSKLLQRRPMLRPAEVLEAVPGLVVTQHSGDGKANQYFLRGFNLDHGTDFATWVDGMPANMPTHAHGQGYTDLNWLVPELVDRVAFRKGPYWAQEGDFASAGAARIALVDRLPANLAQFTAGPHGWRRALLAGNAALGPGQLLYALEQSASDGPWRVPQGLQRRNLVLRWSVADGPVRWSLTGMAYAAHWTATDQVPQRALDAGLVDRWGTIDPNDGGRTGRRSLSWAWQRRDAGGQWRASAYAIGSRLDLWSNFTYQLDNPADLPAANTSGVAGDQFAQSERRRVLGGELARRWDLRLGGVDGAGTLGVQWRQDRLDPVGLYATEARQRAAVLQESRVRQRSVGLYAQAESQWAPWLRTVAGWRADHHAFDVASSIADNSGRRDAFLASPKLSVVLGPWAQTEWFANWGRGFHSNDARGTVTRLSPRGLLPTEPVSPLVRTRGAELGVRTELVPRLHSALALWQLALDSELVFAGDAGDTQASRASRRRGIEWSNRWQALPWLLVDADLAWSRARFTQDDPAGNLVPGAVGRVATLGVSVVERGPWSGQFQLRHVGPRPLLEDGSQRSAATTLASLRVGWRATPTVRLALDVFNLFDRRAADIEYWYVSRLAGEPLVGVADRHLHPVEPRSVRLTLAASF